MNSSTMIHLQPRFFDFQERVLVAAGDLTASAFRYSTGVCALKLRNLLGAMVVLPFQGQQVWSAQFCGRQLAMRSMFPEPNPTRTYLENYGALVIHCGATAMGVPSAEDHHPLHGELPNAPYQEAALLVGEDARGPYMGITGTYRYTVAFSYNYIAQPQIKLYPDSGRMPLSISIKNRMTADMEVMYLAHLNFRPVDNGRLVSSAPCDPKHFRVRDSLPPQLVPPEGYREFLNELKSDPAKHTKLSPDLKFDPEVVLYIDCRADKNGWSHSMQVHPDGTADFVSHRPTQLEHGIRWISRTGDQDALGLLLPATAGPEGYLTEKKKGRIKCLPALSELNLEMELGFLNAEEAKVMEVQILDILGD